MESKFRLINLQRKLLGVKIIRARRGGMRSYLQAILALAPKALLASVECLI